MPAQSETELISFQDRTLRVRPAREEPARLLLMIHGWTGDENSMWVFARDLPARYWIIAPRAPYATTPTGYSWQPVRSPTHERPTFGDLQPAAEALLPFVDAYAAKNKLDASRFDMMGFSQGAALATTIALLHPERIGRVAVLAGFVPAGAESLISRQPLSDLPFFVAHGTRDEMVPINVARKSVELLQQAGAEVSYCEDDVGHKLSAACMKALQAYFR